MARSKFYPTTVKVNGPSIKDTRLFTKVGKLNSYLKMIKNHYLDKNDGTKVEIKQEKYKLN